MEETNFNFERRIWIVIGGFIFAFLFLLMHLGMVMVLPEGNIAHAPGEEWADIEDFWNP